MIVLHQFVKFTHHSSICRPTVQWVTILWLKYVKTQLKLENPDTNKLIYLHDIPAKLVVECAECLSVPLTAIFNQCFVDGTFPVCFKRAIISPIPKNRTPKVPSDLWPISKTFIFSKIFESFIFYFLFDYVQDKITPNLFGFRPNHSTMHCLIYILDTVFKHLELNSSCVEVGSADTSKALTTWIIRHSLIMQGL